MALNTIIEPDGTQRQILRENMPFGSLGAGEFGTYFIGYAATPSVTELMLQRMFLGDPPGNYDRILDFSTAVTGTLFFVPTADFLDDPPALPGEAGGATTAGGGEAAAPGRDRPERPGRRRRRVARDRRAQGRAGVRACGETRRAVEQDHFVRTALVAIGSDLYANEATPEPRHCRSRRRPRRGGAALGSDDGRSIEQEGQHFLGPGGHGSSGGGAAQKPLDARESPDAQPDDMFPVTHRIATLPSGIMQRHEPIPAPLVHRQTPHW